jgi:glutamyl-tRNA(Gln) amidotransferase subunit E
MPLIETVTGPDMLTPNEAADIAVICSKVVRSTGKVRRGIGAAREDVNVSVKGGTRIEIKGVPRIPDIPLLTYNEAMRQWNLLRLREELKKRGITADSFKADSFDITTLIKIPHYTPLREAVEEGLKIKCVVLRGFKDLLHWQTQTDTYFSREISDRVRVIACLTKIPNIIHSDSKGDTLTSFEWQKIKKASGASDKDTMVIVWGDEQDTETAVKEIIIRAKEAAIGVPSETRQALSDGTNGFERILPGADRMYPDTDLPPHEITEERIQTLRSSLPTQFWMREEKYKKLKVPADVLSELSISKFAAVFEDAVEKNIDPVFASVVLIQYPKRLKKEGVDISKINDDTFKQLFNFLAEGKIIKEAVYPLLIISSSRQLTEKELPQICTLEEIKRTISESVSEFNSLNISVTEKKKNVLMGIVMKRLRGRVEGKIVAANINHILEEVA